MFSANSQSFSWWGQNPPPVPTTSPEAAMLHNTEYSPQTHPVSAMVTRAYVQNRQSGLLFSQPTRYAACKNRIDSHILNRYLVRDLAARGPHRSIFTQIMQPDMLIRHFLYLSLLNRAAPSYLASQYVDPSRHVSHLELFLLSRCWRSRNLSSLLAFFNKSHPPTIPQPQCTHAIPQWPRV